MNLDGTDLTQRSIEDHDRRLLVFFVVFVLFGVTSAIMLPVVALASGH